MLFERCLSSLGLKRARDLKSAISHVPGAGAFLKKKNSHEKKNKQFSVTKPQLLAEDEQGRGSPSVL